MIELLLVIILTIIGVAERAYAGRVWAAERQRLVDLIAARNTGEFAALQRAAAPKKAKAPSGPAQVRPIAEGL